MYSKRLCPAGIASPRRLAVHGRGWGNQLFTAGLHSCRGTAPSLCCCCSASCAAPRALAPNSEPCCVHAPLRPCDWSAATQTRR
ncbi:hypothetical protein GN956_G10159 [Arapaima gigas]